MARRPRRRPGGRAVNGRTHFEPTTPVTLAFDVTMRYGAALTSSDTLYLSGTVRGGLANAPSLGGTEPVAFVVDATRIHVLQN